MTTRLRCGPGVYRGRRDEGTAHAARPDRGSTSVPFFFKQWGGVRKKRAVRLLDGRTWDEMPVGAVGGECRDGAGLLETLAEIREDGVPGTGRRWIGLVIGQAAVEFRRELSRDGAKVLVGGVRRFRHGLGHEWNPWQGAGLQPTQAGKADAHCPRLGSLAREHGMRPAFTEENRQQKYAAGERDAASPFPRLTPIPPLSAI